MRPIEAALAYATRRWPVFPCDPRQDAPDAKRKHSKAPLVAGPDKDADGKPVPHTGGLWRATTDESQLRAWWGKHPDALIGLPTGARSGVFVIDLDPRGETVADVEARLVAAVGELPPGPRSLTQSGGAHLWFALPEGEEIPKNSAKRIKGVDWRGEGGYVILPPSVMSDGKAYVWAVKPALASRDGLPFPAAPPKLLDLVFQRGEFARGFGAPGSDAGPAPAPAPIAKAPEPGDKEVRHYALGALDKARAEMAATGKGSRGHNLNATAHGLAPFITLGALSEREVFAAMQDAADACGLTAEDGERERDAKIRRGIDSGLQKTAEKARKIAEIRADARAKARRYGQAAPYRPAPTSPDAEEAPAQPARDEPSGGNGGKGPGKPPIEGSDDEPDPDVVRACSLKRPNDTDNGWRLIAHFGTDMLQVRDVGPHIWTGTHWEPEGASEAFTRFAQRTAERISLEAEFLTYTREEQECIDAAGSVDRSVLAIDARGKPEETRAAKRRAAKLVEMAESAAASLDERRQARRKFSIASGNTGKIEGMITQAAVHHTITPEQLDVDPLAINLRNGTLRIYKERVREIDPDCPDPNVTRYVDVIRWRVRLDPHQRSDHLGKLMQVSYDPDATCPKWDAFLIRFQPKEAIRRFLQMFFGYSMTGLTGVQAFLYNYGLGANGKTTFIEALARLMGSYAHVLQAEALTGDMQRRSDTATPEFARLPGARLVRVAELPRGQGLRENIVKLLTGGEKMLVRHLHQKFFEFRPIFKAVGSGNDRPKISGVDEGIWRRVKLVPWQVTIPDRERRDMESVLLEFSREGSGILNWLIAGLIDYLENGFTVPQEIEAATESYRNDMDPVGEFVGACVVPAPGEQVQARSMFQAYVAWCHANSVKPFSETGFANIMKQKNYERHEGRLRFYKDVRLHDVPDDPDRTPGY